jgi:hypothetical protein
VIEIEAGPHAGMITATETDRKRRVASAGRRNGATTIPAAMTAA